MKQKDLFANEPHNVTAIRRPVSKGYEVHEHSYTSGPNAGRSKKLIHSHERGEIPHTHRDTGPACYTIDKDEWFQMTGGVEGGSRKEFSDAPTGDQLPFEELSAEDNSFEIHYGAPPPGWTGTGGGHLAAARMILRFRMTVAKIVPFPGKPRRASA